MQIYGTSDPPWILHLCVLFHYNQYEVVCCLTCKFVYMLVKFILLFTGLVTYPNLAITNLVFWA